MTLTRPLLRWHGGKWRLAPWIIEHLPPHRIYVEPFGGAASVLLRKPRAYAEIYNDLENQVVELFRLLQRQGDATELCRRLDVTPFSRAEFNLAYESTDCPIERCRRLVIRSFMGFGSDGSRLDVSTGFRSTSRNSGTTPAHDWDSYPAALRHIIERLRGVVIESRDAIACMVAHDGPDTLHYIDPPYLSETRQISHRLHGYTHELTNEDHVRLLDEVGKLQGMVLLSGYPSELYTKALASWRTVERLAHADGARPRREVLWINRAADRGMAQMRLPGHDSGAQEGNDFNDMLRGQLDVHSRFRNADLRQTELSVRRRNAHAIRRGRLVPGRRHADKRGCQSDRTGSVYPAQAVLQAGSRLSGAPSDAPNGHKLRRRIDAWAEDVRMSVKPDRTDEFGEDTTSLAQCAQINFNNVEIMVPAIKSLPMWRLAVQQLNAVVHRMECDDGDIEGHLPGSGV